MGLQVPSTSYLKPMGALISGKPLRKKESVKLKEVVHKIYDWSWFDFGW